MVSPPCVLLSRAASQSIPIEVFALGLDIIKTIAGFALPLPAGSLFLCRAHSESRRALQQP